MRRSSLLFPFILLASLPLTSFGLTVPSLDLIDQSNYTAAPLLSITGHHQLKVTNIPPSICYFITDPPMSTLSDLKCSFLAEDFCAQLGSPVPKPRNKWVWAEISGCALGYYFPTESILPNQFTCEHRIFSMIRRQCATDPQYNAGAINVGQLPDFGGDGTEVYPYQGRYLMAPERLTL